MSRPITMIGGREPEPKPGRVDRAAAGRKRPARATPQGPPPAAPVPPPSVGGMEGADAPGPDAENA